jgi:hypothetical protein
MILLQMQARGRFWTTTGYKSIYGEDWIGGLWREEWLGGKTTGVLGYAIEDAV